jgi:hypothetical protein
MTLFEACQRANSIIGPSAGMAIDIATTGRGTIVPAETGKASVGVGVIVGMVVAVAEGVGVQDRAVFVPATAVSVSRATAVSAAEVKTACGLGCVVG